MLFEALSGPSDGDTFEAEGEVINIGRKSECEVCLSLDSLISRRHAAIKREGDRYVLMDVGSRNGTKLGDRALAPDEPAELHEGDVFTVGGTQLRVVRLGGAGGG